nr:Aminomethyltransferase [Streptococcus thermophilus]
MSYRSPILAVRGATELPDASLIDAAGVPSHYSDPLREQRAVERGGVVIDRSHRRVIRVAGPDAPVFLNNLLSQKLDSVSPGFTAAALDLDMQGRILHHADVTRTEDAFYLDVPSYAFETFLDFLTKMIFWSDVTVEEADLAILTVLGAPASFDPAAALAAPPAFVRTVDWRGPRRIDIAVPREELMNAFRALRDSGLTPAGIMTFTAERIKALEPEQRADLDAKSIPHEAHTLIARGGNLGAVHLDKGCYRGQETVARVENLGRSPRLLVMLHIDGSAPVDPQPGDTITMGGRTVGRLGSVAHDCDYGPIGLALVKRSALNAPATPGPAAAVGAQLEIHAGSGANTTDPVVVSASVDPDSLPADEGQRAGRVAVDKLRGNAKTHPSS